MSIQGESLFALVRRRESIRALAQQDRRALPSSLTEDCDVSHTVLSETPAQKLQRDLATLDAKKKKHLVVPHHKGGKKMNRSSRFGLFLGFLVIGSVFFVAGYLMCLSVNPPNGGLVFEPKYDTTPVGKSVPMSTHTSAEDTNAMPDVSQKSYVDRQALLARANNRSKKTGLLEQSEQRTYDNVKNQVKNTVSHGLRSLSQKLSHKLSPGLDNIVRPLTDELPQTYARTNLDNTFNHPNDLNPMSYVGKRAKTKNDPEQSSSTSNTIALQKNKQRTSSPQQTPADVEAGANADAQQTEAAAPSSRQALYAIRIHRFNDRLSALKLAEELTTRGYDGYVVSVWNNQGHFDFEVRSGAYASYEDTLKAKAILQQVWQGSGVELPRVVMINKNEEIIRP